MEKQYKILCKFPTRQRPDIFLKVLQEYHAMCMNLADTFFLITCDNDDLTMTDEVIAKAEAISPIGNIKVCRGDSKTKIEAVNADFDKIPEHFQDWDIVFVISDDMQCEKIGWDETIRDAMKESSPDTDFSLWFFDKFQTRINTISCLGRKYYERFNFIYNTEYKSLYCDNTQTEIGLMLGKLKFYDTVICSHQHYCWGGGRVKDSLYARNDAFWNEDEQTYNRHKANNFGFPI
jgi:hypothetical protein